MPLKFGTVNSDRVVHGAGATLANLPIGGFSIWAIVVRTANGANLFVMSKDAAGTAGWTFMVNNAAGEGQVRAGVLRGTTNADFASLAGAVPLNVPTFMGSSYDPAATPQINLYAGPAIPGGIVTLLSTAAATAGVGTTPDDSASLVYAGNLQLATSVVFKGSMFSYGVCARVLALRDFQAIARRAGGSCAHLVPDCRLLARAGSNGRGGVLDESGNANHGTITGAIPTNDYLPRTHQRAA